MKITITDEIYHAALRAHSDAPRANNSVSPMKEAIRAIAPLIAKQVQEQLSEIVDCPPRQVKTTIAYGDISANCKQLADAILSEPIETE